MYKHFAISTTTGKARLSMYIFSNTIEHRIFYAISPYLLFQHFVIYYFNVSSPNLNET